MKTRWVFLNRTSSSSLFPFHQSQTTTLALNHIDLTQILRHSRTSSSIHASIVKNAEFHDSENVDLVRDVIVIWNSLLSVYSKKGVNGLSDAVKLFDEMPVRDTVSWNTMISGFLRNGQLDIGFNHFNRMRETGFHRFDQASLTTVLSGLNGSYFLKTSKMIHCLAFRSGHAMEITVGNALVTSYFKCQCYNSGRRVFDEMFARNVVTWTALISGLVQNDFYEQSLTVFMTMRGGTVPPNSLTLLSLLVACSGLQALTEGRQIHGLVSKMGIDSDLHVESALMDMYSKCGSVEDAWKIFDSAKELDEIAMTIILMGFVQNGFEEEAIQIFKKMVKSEKLEIDANVVSAVLGVFGNDTSLGLGKQIHALIFKKNLTRNSYVGNGLINMYSKCGELDRSLQVFDEMPKKNSVSWNSAVAAFARHGHGFGALELYERMRLEGVEPTDVTFLSLLHACSHVGLVQKGMEILKSMSEDHKISPRAEHYACIVDMLGRAGLLTEAKRFIEALPEKRFMSALVWQALLGACSFHGDSELGKFAAEKLFETDPESSASYVLLANIYSSEGKWKERARTIKSMKERGVSKETGVSWIEVEKKVHSFVVSDNLHPQGEAIYGVLTELLEAMADEGYVPDKRFVLHYCKTKSFVLTKQ